MSETIQDILNLPYEDMGARYAKELDDCADTLQHLHPIGAVKAIGRLEVHAAVASLPPGLNWIEPNWGHLTGAEDDDPGEWPFVGDQFLAAVQVHHQDRSGKEKWYWEYTVLTWSESGLEAAGESWSAWGESDIAWIARIPEPPRGE